MDRKDRRELRARIRAAAPRCLQGFRTTLFEPYDYQCSGIEPHWELACACGGEVGTILGRIPEEPLPGQRRRYSLEGPLAFECAACLAINEIIDPALHGYHAEAARLKGMPEAAETDLGPRVRHGCRGCGQLQFRHVTAAFRSWDAAYDLAEQVPGLPLGDFFQGFTLWAVCEGDKYPHRATIARLEGL